MGTNGVSGNGKNFQLPNFWSKPNLKTAKAEQTNAAAPIKLTGLDTIKRENLDELSPYAALGVKFSAKAPEGSIESYINAAPEFGRWHGKFGPLNNKELAALDNLSSLYARIADNKADVTAHLKNSPFDVFAS